MDRASPVYRQFVEILREELIPAMGCTEPIAVAYAAAMARDILGAIPDRVLIEASSSIIKNVKSVVVPHSGHLRGLSAAAATGLIAGKPLKGLELISSATEEEIAQIHRYMETVSIETRLLETPLVFDLAVTVWQGKSSAKVRLANSHTHVVCVEKNGVLLKQETVDDESSQGLTDRSNLTVESIWDFAQSLDPSDVRTILDRQITCNMAIAEEGLRGEYGANIGRVLLKTYGEDVRTRAKAMAAAGSDARMNGCEMPVIINSGSGNQGITVSVPVIVYARDRGASDDDLYRALALANLVAIHQKDGIGRLSAFCGAVTAAAGAGAGIAYLLTRDYETVVHTIVNTLAIVSGMICDGAKASCAAKIASAVDAAILAFNMFRNGHEFHGGDGIITKGVEATIRNVARLGHDGMKATNEEILRIMTGE